MVKHREGFGISTMYDSRRDTLLRDMISWTYCVLATTVGSLPLANNVEYSPTSIFIFINFVYTLSNCVFVRITHLDLCDMLNIVMNRIKADGYCKPAP